MTHKIINPHTNATLLAGSYDQCRAYLRRHWARFERGDIELVYAASGRAASFVL